MAIGECTCVYNHQRCSRSLSQFVCMYASKLCVFPVRNAGCCVRCCLRLHSGCWSATKICYYRRTRRYEYSNTTPQQQHCQSWYSVDTASYLIFSSRVPRVSNTRPQNSSLKAMPRCWWPPHAPYNQSASTGGTPSDSTSCRNAFLLSEFPPAPADFLKASRMRRISLSDTGIGREKDR